MAPALLWAAPILVAPLAMEALLSVMLAGQAIRRTPPMAPAGEQLARPTAFHARWREPAATARQASL